MIKRAVAAGIRSAGSPRTRPTATTGRRLRAEVKELRRANEILKAASAFFAAELDRPATALVRFIDEHKDVFGVEPICRVLTEHGARSPRAPTTPPSAGRRRAGRCATGSCRPRSAGCGRTTTGLRRRQGLAGAEPAGHSRPVHGERLMRELGLRARGAAARSAPRSPATARSGPRTWCSGTSPRPPGPAAGSPTSPTWPTPSSSASPGMTCCAARLGGRFPVATTTTARSGSLPSPPPDSWRTRPFMTCGTPLPAPLWPKACRSPRSLVARPQVDHDHRGPVRPPGARGQRPCPRRARPSVRLRRDVPRKCPRRLVSQSSAAGQGHMRG